jgi:hypothetical protein
MKDFFHDSKFILHTEGWEQGRKIGEGMEAGGARPEFVHHFLHGERYKKNPELVREFLAALPETEIPTRYAVFVPLSDKPRCIAGLIDLSARKYLRPQAGRDALTFTMPYGRFLQMEANVPGSFLEEETWQSLKE